MCSKSAPTWRATCVRCARSATSATGASSICKPWPPEWGIGEKSLRKLSAIVLGQRVSKAQRLSNWEAATLTDKQQLYAATDAWVCIRIYEQLLRTPKKPIRK